MLAQIQIQKEAQSPGRGQSEATGGGCGRRTRHHISGLAVGTLAVKKWTLPSECCLAPASPFSEHSVNSADPGVLLHASKYRNSGGNTIQMMCIFCCAHC